jgi:hypothetical protein
MMPTSIQLAFFGFSPRFRMNGIIATEAGKERKKPTSYALKFWVIAARVDTRYEPQIKMVSASATQAKTDCRNAIKTRS